MPAESVALAFPLAGLATLLATPLAIRLAHRMQLLDRPAGYKGHGRPTPYLGGAGMLAGIAIATLWLGAGSLSVVVGCAAILCALGTVDDRHNLSPELRVAVEIAVAAALWGSGHGWELMGSPVLDLVLTVVTVLAVINATNLMDNMDGAACSTTGISCAGAGALALTAGETMVAGLCLAVAGACAAFLRFNLARPSRIFMGDGGSMPLGLFAAAGAMAAAQATTDGVSAVVVAFLLTSVVALDSTLVTVSRLRAGRPVLSGGRDHLTHRLAAWLGTPTRIALALAAAQGVLAALTVLAVSVGPPLIVGLGMLALAASAATILVLESVPAPIPRAGARTQLAQSP